MLSLNAEPRYMEHVYVCKIEFFLVFVYSFDYASLMLLLYWFNMGGAVYFHNESKCVPSLIVAILVCIVQLSGFKR